MPQFQLSIGISPQSISELEDCVLLLKWRTGAGMSNEEVGKLEKVILNFSADSQVLIRAPWGIE